MRERKKRTNQPTKRRHPGKLEEGRERGREASRFGFGSIHSFDADFGWILHFNGGWWTVPDFVERPKMDEMKRKIIINFHARIFFVDMKFC